jgi:hypothetical protein
MNPPITKIRPGHETDPTLSTWSWTRRVGFGNKRTRCTKQVRKGPTRDASQQRIYQPSENCRDAAAQPDRFELDVNATIFFFQTPVAVESPEIADAFHFCERFKKGGCQLLIERRFCCVYCKEGFQIRNGGLVLRIKVLRVVPL